MASLISRARRQCLYVKYKVPSQLICIHIAVISRGTTISRVYASVMSGPRLFSQRKAMQPLSPRRPTFRRYTIVFEEQIDRFARANCGGKLKRRYISRRAAADCFLYFLCINITVMRYQCFMTFRALQCNLVGNYCEMTDVGRTFFLRPALLCAVRK